MAGLVERRLDASGRAQGGTVRGVRRRGGVNNNTRGGERLVLLSNAISCYLLLAEVERQLAPRTVVQYRAALVKIETFAHEHNRERLDQFTPNLVRGAAAAAMDSPGSAPNWRGGEAMAALIVAASRTMVRRLHDEYPDLPLPDLSVLKAPRVPERIQPRLENGEFARLEAALRLRLLRDRVPRFLVARDMAILEVLSNTGLRANECCSLDLDDIDLDEGTVRVRKGKGNKWRILTVVDPEEARDGGEVVRALADYLRYRERTFGPGRSAALWLTPKGNRLTPNNLRAALRSLCDEAGIDGNRPPHAFRRAHFTEQYRAQPMALPILVERMGWGSDAMAKVYTRGVDVELARRIPLPLMSKAWRNSPKVPIPRDRRSALPPTGVSPGGGGEATIRPRRPYTGDGALTASVSPRRRGSRPSR